MDFSNEEGIMNPLVESDEAVAELDEDIGELGVKDEAEADESMTSFDDNEVAEDGRFED